VASAEHGHFLGACHAHTLHDSLDAAEQRQQTERRFSHAEESRVGRQDHVAGQRQFETTAERAAMHGRYNRDADILKGIKQGLEVSLVAASAACCESCHVRASAEVAHAAAQENRPAPCLDSAAVRCEQVPNEDVVKEVVRRLCHGDDADGAIFFKENEAHVLSCMFVRWVAGRIVYEITTNIGMRNIRCLSTQQRASGKLAVFNGLTVRRAPTLR
jgi:hypothetical protein